MKKLLLFILLICITQINAQICFNPAVNYAVGGTNFFSAITSADFNGDGKADLATANSKSHDISILLGTGIGSFGVATNFGTGISGYSIISSDFNGDGKADLATIGSAGVLVLLGTGTGSFGSATNFLVNSPYSICSTDFNGDGIPDLATANGGPNSGPGTASLLLGTGTGGFGATTNFATNCGPESITYADFNGDGKKDLGIVYSDGSCPPIWGSDGVSVLLGTGIGSFAPVDSFLVNNLLSSLTSADFNGDAKADVAVVCDAANIVSVLLGTGTGSFGPRTNFSTNSIPSMIISADFNGDGKIDLVTTNWGSADVSVLLGTGTGSFGTPVNFTVGTGPNSIINGDFNGDGKVDLAVIDTSNNVSVLLNCTPTPTCVASVTDSLFNISPLNWGLMANYSPQVTSAVWYWGDGTYTNALYPSHTYTAAGWYNICVTAYTSCGDSASTCRNDSIYRMASNSSMVNINVLQNPNTINQISNSINQFSIYPNPANETFVLELKNKNISLQITDVLGNTVKYLLTSTEKTVIDVSDLQNGVYFISARDVEQKVFVTKKIIVQH